MQIDQPAGIRLGEERAGIGPGDNAAAQALVEEQELGDRGAPAIAAAAARFATAGPIQGQLAIRECGKALAVGGSLIYLFLGVFLGTLAARFRGTATDRGLVTFSVFVSSIPYYVVALLMWIFFSLTWKTRVVKPG